MATKKNTRTKTKAKAAPKKAAKKVAVRKIKSHPKESKQTQKKITAAITNATKPKAKKPAKRYKKSLKPEYSESIMGRPEKYTKELGAKICLAIATTTDGLKRICEAEGMPCTSTVYKWLFTKVDADFTDNYARAREAQGELLDDEIIEIADNNKFDSTAFVGGNFVQRAKLMIDARKIKSARLNPKKYGDKLDLTTGGDKLEQVQIFIPDNGRDKKA